MKIAILGSVALSVPPEKQGGSEWVAYYQAKFLAEKGHKVLLFGGKGTAPQVRGEFDNSRIEVIEVGGDVFAFDSAHMESSRILRREMAYLVQVCQILVKRKNDYDIILNNMRGEVVFLPVAEALRKPFVHVLHLNLFEELANLFGQYKTPLIALSEAQKTDFPDLNYLATIPNGVDVDSFSFNPIPKNYLLMMGTIGRHKNQKTAIKVAKKTGNKLVLAGKIRDKDYFEELQHDIDGEQIKWVGEVRFSEKEQLYRNAKALLFPVVWSEPFGMVMIEAMSCGTPVIGFRKGAVSEVVVDGLTGFVVDTEKEMIEAIGKIGQVERKKCREEAEKRFTYAIMGKRYEKVLSNIF